MYLSPQQRAEKLLQEYRINSVSDLNLVEIANAEYLIVEEEDLSNHLGRISFGSEFGLIKIDSKIKEPGQKRFTLGHEMGHFFNEREFLTVDTKKYNCNSDDISAFKISKTREDNANSFAVELLMYKPWFSDYIRKREINFELIKEIARNFNVSLTSAAIRYSEIGKFPIAVILSRDGKKVWSSINEYFPFRWIPKEYAVRKESAAYDFFALTPYPSPKGRGEYKEMQTCADLIPAYTWFAEDYKCRQDVYLYEQNVAMPNYNSVLTLLWESEFK